MIVWLMAAATATSPLSRYLETSVGVYVTLSAEGSLAGAHTHKVEYAVCG